MKVIVNIHLKEGVLDPQGKATHQALQMLGFTGANDVKIGKQIIIETSHTNEKEAKESATLMCKELLVNEVIEDYTLECQ